jgi:hypothetical protein
MRIDLNTARGLAFVPGVMHGKEYASLVIVIGVNAMQANNDLIYIYIYIYTVCTLIICLWFNKRFPLLTDTFSCKDTGHDY